MAISIPYAVASAEGLSAEHRETVLELLNNWQSHYSGNVVRSQYYEARNMLKDLGIAVPDSLQGLEVACGWGYKCVEVMRDHVSFDGFTSPEDYDTEKLLKQVARRNFMPTRVGKAVNSALKYCFSMWVVTSDEEGHARISAYPPTLCTGIWDDVGECLSAGMWVVSFAKERGRKTNRPDWVDVMLDDCLIRLRADGDGRWSAEYVEHGLGIVPMFVMPYNPDDDRPFGVSRINSEVRWLIDCAMRASVNEEVAAAFAASTQKYLLGTDGDAFEDKTKWSAFIGSIFEVLDEQRGADSPIRPAHAAEHAAHDRAFLQPLQAHERRDRHPRRPIRNRRGQPEQRRRHLPGELPAHPQMQDLHQGGEGRALPRGDRRRRDRAGKSYAEAEEACDVSVSFLNPAMPTLAQQTDSSIKLASAVDGFAGTPTFWRLNGLDDDEVRNVMSEIRRNVTRPVAFDVISAASQDQAQTAQEQAKTAASDD